MGDKPAPAKADGKAEADARRTKQSAVDSGATQPPDPQPDPQDGKPFPSPAKNTTPPEENPPKPEIKRRHPEPTD